MLALAICQSIAEARWMAQTQQLAWKEFNEAIDSVTMKHWASLSTEPQEVDGKLTSVFTMPNTPEASLPLKLSELSLIESSPTQSVAVSCQPGTASWIVTAVEIQADQHQLTVDTMSHGTKPTPRQTTEIATRQAKLLKQLEKHCTEASQFFPMPASLEQQSTPQDDIGGQPELLSTLLPSNYPSGSHTDGQSSPVIEWE
ncbi:hypothetical protein FRC09_010741 [Ceratobasidium sp. 395]|nr:hypothetical protein FRC09_010741 [Ceratobasidium sp. 395]